MCPLSDIRSVVTVRDFAFPVGFDRFFHISGREAPTDMKFYYQWRSNFSLKTFTRGQKQYAHGHCKRYRATGPHSATGPESTWT